MRMQVCGVLRAYLKDEVRCWYYLHDSIVALDSFDYWSFYCAGCVVEGERIIVANDLSVGMFNGTFHLHFQHGVEWIKFWKMNDNVEGSGRRVFKTLIPYSIFRKWGKLRKNCNKTPSNSGPPKYAVGILTTQPRNSLNEWLRIWKKTVVMFFTVQVGSCSKKKLPTQDINLLTQPRFEPVIFLVKIRTSPVHHRARLYSSVSEDNWFQFYLKSRFQLQVRNWK